MTASCGQGDAELVVGLRAGDQRCLAGIYDRYADRLYDFCAGMLHDRDAAADAVQDTFVLVNGRIGQLRDPERLRSWLYAIARSVALAQARARSRVRPTDAVIDTADPAAGPEQLAEQEALRRLVADVSEGLAEGDRAMLRLHLHGLEGAELAAALGISASAVHVRLSRLRDQCSARSVRRWWRGLAGVTATSWPRCWGSGTGDSPVAAQAGGPPCGQLPTLP